MDHEQCGSPLKTMVAPNLALEAVCAEHELDAVSDGYRYISDLSPANLLALMPQLINGIDALYEELAEQRRGLLSIIDVQREHLSQYSSAPLGDPLDIPLDRTMSLEISDGSTLYYLRTETSE